MLGLLSLLVSPVAHAGPSVLFDATTGEVISHERAGEPWYPASLTKLMTAYIVFKKLKTGGMRLDQKIVVSPLAASQEPSTADVMTQAAPAAAQGSAPSTSSKQGASSGTPQSTP